MCAAFCCGKWTKERSDDGAHHALFMKINKCSDSIDGLRELVFDLCCDAYERISSIANIRNMEFFQELYQICGTRFLEQHADIERRSREAEERAAQAARAAEWVLSPVDLPEDHVPAASDTNFE